MRSLLTTCFSISRIGFFALILTLAGLGLSPTEAQLSGSYTIGGGGNYTSFGAAVTALTNNGVSGPVTFNVLTGTYNEQIS